MNKLAIGHKFMVPVLLSVVIVVVVSATCCCSTTNVVLQPDAIPSSIADAIIGTHTAS